MYIVGVQVVREREEAYKEIKELKLQVTLLQGSHGGGEGGGGGKGKGGGGGEGVRACLYVGVEEVWSKIEEVAGKFWMDHVTRE